MTLSHHTITITNTPKSNQRKYMFQMLVSLVYFVFVSQRFPECLLIFYSILTWHHFTRIYRNKEHIEKEGETKIVKKAQNLCYEKHCRANVCDFISFFDLRTVRWIFMYVQDFHFFSDFHSIVPLLIRTFTLARAFSRTHKHRAAIHL